MNKYLCMSVFVQVFKRTTLNWPVINTHATHTHTQVLVVLMLYSWSSQLTFRRVQDRLKRRSPKPLKRSSQLMSPVPASLRLSQRVTKQ
jgi:hypothetical protein